MDVSYHVNVRAYAQALKAIDKDQAKELRNGLRRIAKQITDEIRPKVPRGKTGRARRSVKPRASEGGAGVAFGGKTAPYYPWLDFGGTVGRGHRRGAPYSGSIERTYKGPPYGSGRYVYPTIEANLEEIKEAADDVIVTLVRRNGLRIK